MLGTGETNLLNKEKLMPMPEMHSVSSSNISLVGYDAENETVYVTFVNGTTYSYSGVPEHEYENLKTASSVGSYLNRYFKNVYSFARE